MQSAENAVIAISILSDSLGRIRIVLEQCGSTSEGNKKKVRIIVHGVLTKLDYLSFLFGVSRSRGGGAISTATNAIGFSP